MAQTIFRERRDALIPSAWDELDASVGTNRLQ
jgi:hypothetical protein